MAFKTYGGAKTEVAHDGLRKWKIHVLVVFLVRPKQKKVIEFPKTSKMVLNNYYRETGNKNKRIIPVRHTQKTAIISIIALGIVSTPAMAVEISGGDINLKYSELDAEIFGEKLNSFSVDGAVELGFSPNFAAQLDLGYYNFGAIDDNGTTVALHGIYHLNDETSLGAFYGQDELDGDSDFYGIEAVYETGKFEVEGYIGSTDNEGEDAGILGLYGAYGLTERLDVTGGYQIADLDDGSLDRIEVGLKFKPVDEAVLSVSFGSAEVEAFGESGSESFFSIGVEFPLGANKGATFGRRGILQLLPGL